MVELSLGERFVDCGSLGRLSVTGGVAAIGVVSVGVLMRKEPLPWNIGVVSVGVLIKKEPLS